MIELGYKIMIKLSYKMKLLDLFFENYSYLKSLWFRFHSKESWLLKESYSSRVFVPLAAYA